MGSCSGCGGTTPQNATGKNNVTFSVKMTLNTTAAAFDVLEFRKTLANKTGVDLAETRVSVEFTVGVKYSISGSAAVTKASAAAAIASACGVSASKVTVTKPTARRL